MVEFRPDPWWWSFLLMTLAAVALFGAGAYAYFETPLTWSVLAPIGVAALLCYGAWSSLLRIRVYRNELEQTVTIERLRWPLSTISQRLPLSEIIGVEVETKTGSYSNQFGIDIKRRSGPPIELSPLGTRSRAFYEALCTRIRSLLGILEKSE